MCQKSSSKIRFVNCTILSIYGFGKGLRCTLYVVFYKTSFKYRYSYTVFIGMSSINPLFKTWAYYWFRFAHLSCRQAIVAHFRYLGWVFNCTRLINMGNNIINNLWFHIDLYCVWSLNQNIENGLFIEVYCIVPKKSNVIVKLTNGKGRGGEGRGSNITMLHSRNTWHDYIKTFQRGCDYVKFVVV